MKIAEQIHANQPNAESFWIGTSADLAHAIIERVAQLTPDELRAFVSPTSMGEKFAQLSDNHMTSAVAIVAQSLI